MAGFKEYQMLFKLEASLGSSYNSTFQSGSTAVKDLQDRIESLNRVQSDISAFQKQETAVANAKAKMELYAQQLENLKSVTATSANEEAHLKNEIAAKQLQLDKATASYDSASAKLSDMGQALREAGVNTNNLKEAQNQLSAEAKEAANQQAELARESEDMGRKFKTAMEGAAAAIEAAGLVSGLKSIYDALAECTNAASQFETAMAGVKRTVGGDDSFIDNLGEKFKDLSTEIPITATELAGIATTAGQLGIAQKDVEQFTMVMAQLGTTTDLTADNAATMLAQFANITGVTEYDRLGSTVAQLGDATATTASKVVEMSQGMAAAASVAGMSATDVLAISAAVGSLGIEAASGSTSMSTLISTLYKATETGTKLEDFAAVAGMSAEQFKQSWGVDAVGTMNAFIQGLNDTERNGRSAVVILDELGIKNVRQTKAILGLAQAGDLLSNTVKSANAAWESNTALAEKAGIMYGTTEAKLTMAQNAANNLKVAVGDALTPALGSAYDAFTSLIQPISEFISDNPALVQGVTAFVGVLGIATAGVVGYTAATKLAAAASALFGGSIPGVGLILGAAAGIGVLVAAISELSKPAETSADKMEKMTSQYSSLQSEMSKSQSVIDLCNQYKTLSGDVDSATTSVGKLIESLKDDISVNLEADFTNIDEAKKAVDDLGTKVSEAKSSFDTAKKDLDDMVTRYGELETRLTHAKTKKDKNAITQEMEDLSKAIGEQETKVGTLEQAYEDLNGKYTAASTAVKDLEEKEAQLAKTGDELIAASGGKITALEGESSAMQKQIENLQKLEEANKAAAKAKFIDTLTQTASLYAQAVADVERNTQAVNDAAARMAEVTGPEELAGKIETLFNTIKESLAETNGSSWDTTEVKGYRTELESLISTITGYPVSWGNFQQMNAEISAMNITTAESATSLETMSYEMGEYERAAADAAAAQETFISSMVDMIQSGALSMEEAGTAVQAAFSGMENSGDLAAEVMTEVEARMNAAAAAGDTLSDSLNGTSEAEAQAQAALADLDNQLAELQKAYDDAYKSAHDSIDKQIGLFDEMSTKTDKSVSQMIKSLQSQTKYMDEYAQNLKEAAKMGLDDGLIKALSDGSTQSAAYLAEIVQNGATKIDELNAEFRKAKEAKDALSSAMAEASTNFTTEAEKIKQKAQSIQDSLNGLDGTASGVGLGSSLAAGIESQIEVVRAAAAKLAAAAAIDSSANGGTVQSKSNKLVTLSAYASGTQSAERGLALVGEKGPELVYFKGGEQVATAEETMRIARQTAVQATPKEAVTSGKVGGNTNYTIEVKPEYNFSGANMTESELESFAAKQTMKLRLMVETVLSDIKSDKERSVYA